MVHFDSNNCTQFSLELSIETPQNNRAQDIIAIESPEILMDSNAIPPQGCGCRTLQNRPTEEEGNKMVSELGNYVERVNEDHWKLEQKIGRLEENIEELKANVHSKEETIEQLKTPNHI